MKTLAVAVFCVVVAMASAWHGGVSIVPASAHAAVHAGHVPGAVVVGHGGAGIFGWNGLGGLGGLGGWGGLGWGGLGWGGPFAGHDGQYVPDHTELLYDDGSYRPEHHHGW